MILSKNLIEVLGLEKADKSTAHFDLAILCRNIIPLINDDERIVEAYFKDIAGLESLRSLITHLSRFVPHDSVVRDMGTLGHLAKLITRLRVHKNTGNFQVFQLPHPLFDRVSLKEKSEQVGTLDIEAELLNKPEVQEMLLRETEIFDRFGRNKGKR